MTGLITWGQLLIYLFIFLIIYYAAVLALFYRHDLVKLGSRFMDREEPYDARASEEERSEQEGDYDALYNSVHNLMKDCSNIFINVENAPVDKDRLIADLRHQLKFHPEIKGTAFQVSVSNYIAQEASHRLGIDLDDIELEKVWQQS